MGRNEGRGDVTKWLLPLTMGAMLVSIVAFLATRQLGAASQYAAIGSFVVAFVGLGLSLWTTQRRATRADEPAETQPDLAVPSGSTPAAYSSYTVTGYHSPMIVHPEKEVHIGSMYGPDPGRTRKP